jgi:hypothetical protein
MLRVDPGREAVFFDWDEALGQTTFAALPADALGKRSNSTVDIDHQCDLGHT